MQIVVIYNGANGGSEKTLLQPPKHSLWNPENLLPAGGLCPDPSWKQAYLFSAPGAPSHPARMCFIQQTLSCLHNSTYGGESSALLSQRMKLDPAHPGHDRIILCATSISSGSPTQAAPLGLDMPWLGKPVSTPQSPNTDLH